MAARGERFLLQREKEEDDAAACLPPSLSCDKENHFINWGPMWHDLTINLTPVLKVCCFYHHGPSSSLHAAVRRITLQLHKHLAKLQFIVHLKPSWAICEMSWFIIGIIYNAPTVRCVLIRSCDKYLLFLCNTGLPFIVFILSRMQGFSREWEPVVEVPRTRITVCD